jgi:putative sterol carrier protein
VATYPFLSDDWFTEVEKLVAEHGNDAPGADMMMNLTVTETPFGEDRDLHLGAKSGKAEWGQGHTDAADVTLTVDYPTAKEIFVSGNQQAGMQAFMAGKVKVQGDMTKLMAAQAGGGPGGNPELQSAIQGITE